MKLFNSKKKSFSIVLFTIFIVLVHIYIQPVFGDEIHFRTKLISYNYDLISLLIWRWGHWSSRLFLEFPMYLLAVLPPICWKILDCFCFFVLFYILSKFTKQHLFLAVCLCSYPLIHLASAGWIATTTNYLWPFTAGLAAFYLLIKITSLEFTKYRYILLYTFLLLYAGNSELIACLYLLTILLFILYDHFFVYKSRIQNKAILLWSVLLSILGIFNMFLCTGNKHRIQKEIVKWMPAYTKISFLRKLQICIISTIQHFTSIPNVLFLLFGFIIAYLAITDHNFNIHQKIIAFIPFFISIFLTGYYCYFEILKKHYLNYVLPSIHVAHGSMENKLQIILTWISVIYLLCTVISLLFLFYDDRQTGIVKYRNCFCCISIYLGGLCSRFTLLFSPTMLASGTRIYFVFYMAQIWILNKLFDKIQNQSIRALCYFFGSVGMILNFIMIYLLQQKYS